MTESEHQRLFPSVVVRTRNFSIGSSPDVMDRRVLLHSTGVSNRSLLSDQMELVPSSSRSHLKPIPGPLQADLGAMMESIDFDRSDQGWHEEDVNQICSPEARYDNASIKSPISLYTEPQL